MIKNEAKLRYNVYISFGLEYVYTSYMVSHVNILNCVYLNITTLVGIIVYVYIMFIWLMPCL